jgi:UDP-N-acetylmuramoyl-L-alanyl-D-glutamate--2,6-diaminopimelate ligase
MMAGRAEPFVMSLAHLLEGVADAGPVAGPLPVTGLALDSRRIQAGHVFLACPGTGSLHGLSFAEDAVAAGASAILAGPGGDWSPERIEQLSRGIAVPLIAIDGLERSAGGLAARFYGWPAKQMEVTGITGTNGKTSCAHFLAEALHDGRRCALVGTLGNGFAGALQPATHTTPDAVQLQAMFAGFLASGATDVAMEVSSHALHQHRVGGVDFDVAVFTNLSRDHLDYHRTMEAYGEAKARLFAVAGLKAAVINTDDSFGCRLLGTLRPGIETVAYGLDPAPMEGCAHRLVATRVAVTPDGLDLEIEGTWGRGRVQSPLVGRFNALNLLAVLGVLLVRRVPMAEALRRLEAVRGVPGRMERFSSVEGPTAVVDYAHTPDALEKVLGSAREHCAGRLVCVFGCGGDRDRGKRPLMGAVAQRLADAVVLTDDNPRSEDGDAIIREIRAGMARPEGIVVERNRGRAIAGALEQAGSDDWVVVAGKGHEETQQLGDLILPFSDRATVQRALAGGGE